MKRRRSDNWQVWITSGALVFLAVMVVLAQSQDYINATLTERVSGMDLRLNRLENVTMGIVIAVFSNLLAHVIEIRQRTKIRRQRRDEDE